MRYDEYNREERYLCAHLFRLLHEPTNEYRVLKSFLRTDADVSGVRTLCEVALIRDAYRARRANPAEFMDSLSRILMAQDGVEECRAWSELPAELNTPSLTHPNQIRHKAGDLLTDGESHVYGAMQAMFNAKPDLAVCYGGELVVYEAKFTLGFDQAQLARTRNLAEVWKALLYEDLGFEAPPAVDIRTLGMAKFSPDVTWGDVLRLAEAVYPPEDRSRRAFEHAVSSFGTSGRD